jgi:hypothetical protein
MVSLTICLEGRNMYLELNSEYIFARRLYIGYFVALFEELESTKNTNYKIMLPCIVGTSSNLKRIPRYTCPSFWEVVDQLVPLETGTLKQWAEMTYSARTSRWGQVQTPRVLNGLLLVVAPCRGYTHTHALTHMHTQGRTHPHMHTRTHALTHARIQTHTHTRTQTCAHTRTRAHTRTHTHIHTLTTELSTFSCPFIVICPNKITTGYTNTKVNLKFFTSFGDKMHGNWQTHNAFCNVSMLCTSSNQV